MIIREATQENARGIANVLMQNYNTGDIGESVSVFESEAKKEHHYIVAEEDGKILGIATWTAHDLPKHGLAELNRIAVLSEFRRKGIARHLLKETIKSSKEFYQKHGSRLRKLYVLTHESNKKGQAFYEKMGFKHEATLKAHYYENDNERVYSIFFKERKIE